MKRRRLLCTDLDRTLIPNGQQPESAKAAEILQQLVERPEIALAFVTGRHLELVQQAIGEFNLPRPNFVLGDVGASVFIASDRAHQQPVYERDAAWDLRLSREWPTETVTQIRELLAQFPHIQPQEPSKQSRFKLSYYLSPSQDMSGLERELNERLGGQELAANIVLSVDTETDRGLLDLLPPSASKLRAIEYLMQKQGVELGDVLFAGDSGNDLDVFASRVQSVMVANAPDDLKDLGRRSGWPAFKIARGIDLPGIWLDKWGDALQMQTSVDALSPLSLNGNYRGGIIEGMFHYWPETREWLPSSKRCEAS